MIDTERDRAICDKATPGPWEAYIYAPATYRNSVVASDTAEVIARSGVDDNAAFIAHARTALPAYIEEVERLRAELAESKRREQALLSDLKEACANTCGFCLYSIYSPMTGSLPGKNCPGNQNDCNGECKNFDWRGPDDRKER